MFVYKVNVKCIKDRIVRVLICIITFNQLTFPAYGEENIIVDRETRPDKNTAVTKSKNGADVINISTPSKGGVSKNFYNKFNVGDKNGTVFNNQIQSGRSQLGGQIAGNPNIRNRGAKIILNEVTSRGEASKLGSKLEVFGEKALIVISNPHGLSYRDGFNSFEYRTFNVEDVSVFSRRKDDYDDFVTEITPINDEEDVFLREKEFSDKRVRVVFISKASKRGVSKNTFDEFSVDKNGVVINNSTEDGKSILAGELNKNENLDGKSADIVLFEVSGAKKSALVGDMEMFGKRGTFILANEQGILVNGTEFINMESITLSTGEIGYDHEGQFRHMIVENGAVEIGSGGVDASDADYFDVLARNIKVQGLVLGAYDTRFLTGKYVVDVKDNEITPFETKKAEDIVYAIDARELGSMYSGTIRFISTEEGVGVNSGGSLIALNEGIEITADGDIVYNNAVAKTHFMANNSESNGDITQTGKVISGRNVLVSSGKDTLINGDILAGGDTVVAAQEGDVTITGSKDKSVNIVAENILVQAKKSISITEGQLTAADTALLEAREKSLKIETAGISAGTIQEKANEEITHRGSVIETTEGQVFQLAKSITNEDSIIFSAKDIRVLADGTVINRNSLMDGMDVSITAGNFKQEKKGLVNGLETVAIRVNGSVEQAAGSSIDSLGLVAIDANTLINEGAIKSILGTVLTAKTIKNRGDIDSLSALEITAKTDFKNSGEISATNLVKINAGIIENEKEGKINSDTLIILESKGDLKNDGDISSFGNSYINSDKTLENNGLVVAFGSLNIEGGADINNAGTLVGNEGIAISGDTHFKNTGTTMSNSKISVVVKEDIENDGGTILGWEVLAKGEDIINDKNGVIKSTKGDVIVLSQKSLSNKSGTIISAADLRILSPEILLSEGVSALGNLEVQSEKTAVTIDDDFKNKYKFGGDFKGKFKSILVNKNFESKGLLALEGIDYFTNNALLKAETLLDLKSEGILVSNGYLRSGGDLLMSSAGNLYLNGDGDRVKVEKNADIASEEDLFILGTSENSSRRLGAGGHRHGWKYGYEYKYSERKQNLNIKGDLTLSSAKKLTIDAADLYVIEDLNVNAGTGVDIFSENDEINNKWHAVYNQHHLLTNDFYYEKTPSKIRVGGSAVIVSGGDINFKTADVEIEKELVVVGAKSLNLYSEVVGHDLYTGEKEYQYLDKNLKTIKSSLKVNGNANLDLAENLRLDVGEFIVKGDTKIDTGGDLILSWAVNSRVDIDNTRKYKSFYEMYSPIASLIRLEGDAFIHTGQDINIEASALEVGGSMILKADRDIFFKEAITTRHTGEEDWSGRSKVNEHDRNTDTSGSSSKTGGKMTVIEAGRNFTNHGSTIETNGVTSIKAGNDIRLSSVKNSRNYNYWDRKTSGAFESDSDKSGAGLTSEGTVPASFLIHSKVDPKTEPKGYAMVQLDDGSLKTVAITDIDANKNAILDPHFITYLEDEAKAKNTEAAKFQIMGFVDTSVDLLINAKNNIGIQGSVIDVDGSGILKANKEINILNATEHHRSNYWVDKDSWGGADNTKRSGGKIDDKNIISKVHMRGDINIHADDKVLIQGSEVKAGENVDIFGKNDVQILSAEEFSQTVSRKSNNHVVAGKEEQWIQSSLKHIGSTIKSEAGNVTVKSDGGITIEASTIDSGNDVELDAKDIAIRAKKDIHQTAYKKSTYALNLDTVSKAMAGFAIGGMHGAVAAANGESIMEGDSIREYGINEEIAQSQIKAKKNITIKAKNGVLIEGSLIETINGDLVIDAQSLVVKTMKENDSNSSSREEWKIGSFDIETTRSSIGFSTEISSEKEKEAHAFEKHQESVLKAGGAVTLIGKDNVMVLGSNVLAGGDIDILGKDISILSVKEVDELIKSRDKISAKITQVVGNAWVETAYQAEDAYKSVEESQKAVDEMGSDESEINHAAKILQAIFATAQIARVVEGVKASIDTTGSYGFYGAMKSEIKSESEKTENKSETSKASFIRSNFGNINIAADNNVIIMGSHLKTDTQYIDREGKSKGNINIEGENVTFKGEFDETSNKTSFESNTAQTSSGIGNATFSRDESGRKLASGRYMGASVDAAGNLNIKARSNIDVIGSTLTGENVDLEALNGTITVQTMQDYMDDVAESEGISVGQQNGFYVSQDKTRYNWTNTQASIVGRNKVEIKADRLVLEGAKIANIDKNGKDAGHLVVNAKTIIEKDLKDTYVQSHEAFSFGFNKNQKGNEGTQKTKSGATNPADPLDGNITAGYSQNKHEKEQAVRSTIGQGEIITESDITELNRDTDKAMEIIKDKRSGGLDLQVNLPTRYIFGSDSVKVDENDNPILDEAGKIQTKSGVDELVGDLAAIPKMVYTKKNGIGGNLKGAGENIGKAANNLRKAVVDNVSGKSKEGIKAEYQANLRNQELGLQSTIDNQYQSAIEEMSTDKESIEAAEIQVSKIANKAVAIDGIEGDVDVEFYYDADGYTGGHKNGKILINLYYSDGSNEYINIVLGDELSHYVDYKNGKSSSEHRNQISTQRGDDAGKQLLGYTTNETKKDRDLFHSKLVNIDFADTNEFVASNSDMDRRTFIYGDRIVGFDGSNDNIAVVLADEAYLELQENLYENARAAAGSTLSEQSKNIDTFNKNLFYDKENGIYYVPKDYNGEGEVYNLNKEEGAALLTQKTQMTYAGGDKMIHVMTGYKTSPKGAEKNAERISEITGHEVGYINNDTEGVPGDTAEYLRYGYEIQDLLTARHFEKMAEGSQKEGQLILMHSAGNNDVVKALRLMELQGKKVNGQLDFISVGSPRNKTDIKDAVQAVGGNFIGQFNDIRDPVTWGPVGLGAPILGASGGAAVGLPIVAPSLGLYTIPAAGIAAGIAAGVAGIGEVLLINKYHYLDSYIDRNQGGLSDVVKEWASDRVVRP